MTCVVSKEQLVTLVNGGDVIVPRLFFKSCRWQHGLRENRMLKKESRVYKADFVDDTWHTTWQIIDHEFANLRFGRIKYTLIR